LGLIADRDFGGEAPSSGKLLLQQIWKLFFTRSQLAPFAYSGGLDSAPGQNSGDQAKKQLTFNVSYQLQYLP
jgi:hypothetical protein